VIKNIALYLRYDMPFVYTSETNVVSMKQLSSGCHPTMSLPQHATLMIVHIEDSDGSL
jgi:hypothetical protein